MRILLVTQYFWPEPFIINDLVTMLEDQGHEITVLTGKPNYPDGHLYAGYKHHELQQEKFAKCIDVLRVPLRPRGKASSTQLVLNYLSFIWSGLRYFPKLVKEYPFDVILVFAPSPITSAIPAIALKWLKKAHLAIWVQDLWPESLAATNHVQQAWVLKMVGGLVRLIYKSADTLLIQSRAFHAPIAKLAAEEKIVYYPNSVLSNASKKESNKQLPDDLRTLLESKFCLVFGGNLGKAQAMATIVEAAKKLADTEAVIVLVGSGSMSSWVEEQKNTYNLHNLVLAGRFPMEVMPEIYSRASGLLVTLKRDEILGYTIPSKIQAYLAAGKPIIASLDGEGARIVEEAGAGFTCVAEDSVNLAACIRRLRQTTLKEREIMGKNGQNYFMENFEMSHQAENLINILSARISRQESY